MNEIKLDISGYEFLKNIEEIQRYVEHRLEPGSFVKALMANDLIGAFNNADEINQNEMIGYVKFIYNRLPRVCFGS
jgi:hypothetical protein